MDIKPHIITLLPNCFIYVYCKEITNTFTNPTSKIRISQISESPTQKQTEIHEICSMVLIE